MRVGPSATAGSVVVNSVRQVSPKGRSESTAPTPGASPEPMTGPKPSPTSRDAGSVMPSGAGFGRPEAAVSSTAAERTIAGPKAPTSTGRSASPGSMTREKPQAATATAMAAVSTSGSRRR